MTELGKQDIKCVTWTRERVEIGLIIVPNLNEKLVEVTHKEELY